MSGIGGGQNSKVIAVAGAIFCRDNDGLISPLRPAISPAFSGRKSKPKRPKKITKMTRLGDVCLGVRGLRGVFVNCTKL